MISTSIVTGFLGSGKTTLISRVLCDPAFRRVAVIVNEFGEVGLDHELIATADETVMTLNTGCLCCAVQTDLACTLMELHDRRAAGLADYDRVLIETSGLSDPAPMLQSMMSDAAVAATHELPFVVTLVDTVRGEMTLLDHVEARCQVALADRVLFSKTDLAAASDGLIAQLDGLNPHAPRSTTTDFVSLDLSGISSVDTLTERLSRISRRPGHADIESFSIIRDRPIPALALTMLLQAVSEHCGSRMLRLKGLVAVNEMPGRPMVIHGVGHIIGRPDFLDRWPSEDQRTRIVFIARGVPRHFLLRLLDAIEAEVRDATCH